MINIINQLCFNPLSVHYISLDFDIFISNFYITSLSVIGGCSTLLLCFSGILKGLIFHVFYSYFI